MATVAYHGGAFFDAVGANFKTLNKLNTVVSADVLDAWFLPSPKVIKKVKEYLPQLLKNSPPTHAAGLIETIAKVRGLKKENIIVGGGSSDLMFAFFPNFLRANDRVLILDPTYGEYAHIFTHVIGAKLFRHKLLIENNFVIDTNDLIRDIGRVRPKLVVLVNPNSPTGVLFPKQEVLRVVAAAKKFGTIIVVDETYIDYVGSEHSVEREVSKHKNLVVIKSMSKAYALSGARVAYLVAPQKIAEFIRTFIPPWSVSLVGQVAGVVALQDPAYYQRRYRETHRLRQNIIRQLQKIKGIKLYDSVANFFLIQLVDCRVGASQVVKELQKQNIYIRTCDKMGTQFNDNFLRVAVKDSSTNQKIVTALIKVLK